MSFESKVRTAVGPLVNDEFSVNRYTGTAQTWISLNWQEYFRTFADGAPHNVVQGAQLHLFMPYSDSPRKIKRQITQALAGAGFALNSIIDASDGDGRHYVWEFEGHEHDLLDPEPPAETETSNGGTDN